MPLNEHYQIRLVTKERQFAVAQQVCQVRNNVSVEELNSLVNQLLTSDNSSHQTQQFVFLANEYLIKTSLLDYLEAIEEEGKSDESVIEVEYFVQTQAPKPFNAVLNEDWVACVHSNDKYVLSGCYDGHINIWSIEKGTHLVTLSAHKGPVKSVKWLSSQNVQQLSANSFNLAPNDCLFLSTSFDETCALWKWTEKTRKVHKCQFYKGHIRSVDCLDVFNSLFVTGSYDKMIKLWNMSSDATSDVTAAGSAAAASTQDDDDEDDDDRVEDNDNTNAEIQVKGRLDEPIVKGPQTTLAGHSEAVSGVCWIRDADHDDMTAVPQLASCSMDNTIRIWDMETLEQKNCLNGSKAFMTMDYCAVNRLLITGSCDNFVRLFDPRANEGSIVRAGYTSHTGWVTDVSWQKDASGNYFVSGSFDRTVKQWDVRSTKAPLFDLLGHEEKVLTVDWNNRQYITSGSTDCLVKIYECSF